MKSFSFRRSGGASLAVLGALAGLFGAPGVTSGQSLSLERHVIASGGGVSTGGRFALTGTFGQADAGPRSMAGGLVIQGGFWGVAVTVQEVGSPLLAVRQVGASQTFAWPVEAGGFILQVSPTLTPATQGGSVPWTDVVTTPTVVNGENVLTLPVEPGARFYRLRRL